MSNIKEISQATKLLIKSGSKLSNIHLLHCNTEYPTPLKDVNLNAIKSLKKKFKVQVGYSDHTKINRGSNCSCNHGCTSY